MHPTLKEKTIETLVKEHMEHISTCWVLNTFLQNTIESHLLNIAEEAYDMACEHNYCKHCPKEEE